MGFVWSQTPLRETLAIQLSEHKGASSRTTLCPWLLYATLAPGQVLCSLREQRARQPHAAARGMGHQALPPRHPGTHSLPQAHVEKGSLLLHPSEEHQEMV